MASRARILNQLALFPDLFAVATATKLSRQRIAQPAATNEELEDFQGQVVDAVETLLRLIEDAVEGVRDTLGTDPDSGAVDLACEYLDADLTEAVSAFRRELGI